MSELALLEETAAELFSRELAADADPARVWGVLEETGLSLAGVPEEVGGSGGGLAEAAAVVRIAAAHAVPAPIAETALLGGWLLAESGFTVPAGPLTALELDAGSLRRDGGGWVVDGRAARVPWARAAAALAVIADGHVAFVPPEAAAIEPGENLAGEPRDGVAFTGVSLADDDVRPAPAGVDANALRVRGALARSIGLAGALERTLDLTVFYANERKQFGRPIGRFQAIQHAIAVLAGEVAAARGAADLAVDRPEALWVGIAKVRAGDAATKAATIAHQVHGAIGYTEEHELHHVTRRLWAWRDEYGDENEWAARVGAIVAGAADGLWPLLTASGGD
jgi:acyl-CoA dehydrogenase